MVFTHVGRQCPPAPHYPPQQCRGSAALEQKQKKLHEDSLERKSILFAVLLNFLKSPFFRLADRLVFFFHIICLAALDRVMGTLVMNGKVKRVRSKHPENTNYMNSINDAIQDSINDAIQEAPENLDRDWGDIYDEMTQKTTEVSEQTPCHPYSLASLCNFYQNFNIHTLRYDFLYY